MPNDDFFKALDEAEDALRRATRVMQGVKGIDIAEDRNLQRLRQMRVDIDVMSASVEEYGFGGRRRCRS